MSFSQRYGRAPADDDLDSDSDADLALDELDPIPAHSSHRSTFGRWQDSTRLRLQNLSTGASDSNGKARKRNGLSNGKEEDLTDLVDGDADTRESAGSLSRGEDDAPLLSPARSRRGPGSKTTSRSTSANGGMSRFLTKIRSTPRSEVEEQYDTSVNRVIRIGQRQATRYPPNVVSNAKYTPWSFLPRTLYNEFSFFFNMYFLLVALSQIIPPLRIGYLSTYIAPLAFVITITLSKEAFDDIARRRRDAEANAERYTVLTFDGYSDVNGGRRKGLQGRRPQTQASRLSDVDEEEAGLEANGNAGSVRETSKASRDLKVGDVLKLEKNQRVPADAVILQSLSTDAGTSSSQEGGEAFIRTDQLDGETDWKLRLAPVLSQSLSASELGGLVVNAGKPERKVNEFVGNISVESSRQDPDSQRTSMPLNIDNTAWANTVLASSAAVYAVVVYTGHQTRQALSTSASRTKTGLLEYEINSLTKILCLLTFLLSFGLVAAEKFQTPEGGRWYVAVMRFLILFSTIIPISLRVNVDLAKSVYANIIQKDEDIPGTVVRTSTIPEDLGRIDYLLSDKTGTLTQNDMQLKKIHVGTVSYANDAMSEVTTHVRQEFAPTQVETAAKQLSSANAALGSATSGTRSRREIGSRVRDVVLALALCHNVTPTTEDEQGEKVTTYQASSPDEIAIVQWTESVGLRLAQRDRYSMSLESSHTNKVVVRVQILNMFPFTSDSKRMGIVVKFVEGSQESAGTKEDPIWFFQKGADTVMSRIVASNDWLEEETATMAREGLRTLVVGRKKLSQKQYEEFAARYRDASISLDDRDARMASVVGEHLEQDLELLGLTGVEDRLQHDVKPSLELLRNAGVKIWMLTGDKVETARCVAISARLVARGQYIHTMSRIGDAQTAADSLDFLASKPNACLLVDGETLSLLLEHHRTRFISLAVTLPAVVACRCSPTQKADVASLIQSHTRSRVCCIGDGGNDVSMIQAADIGVGIVGKEGRQASLAADFSITQFSHLTKLLVWHGRNSYKRSAKLAQFIIHRGLIISVCQTVYSITKGAEPIALYKDWLLVGYATIYTMMPVFSLTLDTDIPAQLAHVYPELYAELSTSKSLSYRTFFIWVAISIYQGCGIQILAQLITKPTPGFTPPTQPPDAGVPPDGGNQYSGVDPRMLSISFTVLIINELVMVAAEITTWHWVMATTILGTAGIYFGSLPFLGRYFDLGYLLTLGFWWRIALIAAVSLVPVYAMKIIRRIVRPPNYRKVQQGL